ncbi:MAG: hypothetical protein P9M07_00440 [Candidatus Aceula meridiana]|nr:hypothetical protein [Candidatus Aceula meridiana]
MESIPMKVFLRRVPNNRDVFEFTIATPILRTQFQLPRHVVNQMRILIERALVKK